MLRIGLSLTPTTEALLQVKTLCRLFRMYKAPEAKVSSGALCNLSS